ncbi:hypothetical protein Dimus_027722 [Dionaea muscipula]
MLVCTHSLLIRIDRALRVASTQVASNRLGRSQGCSPYHAFSYVRGNSGVRDTESKMKKKRKSINLKWRPVSTQSTSHEALVVKDNAEDLVGFEHSAVLENMTTVVAAVGETSLTPTAPQDNTEVIEAIGVGADPAFSSISLQGDELKDAEEVLADSVTTSATLHNTAEGDTEALSVSLLKHSASLEVGASVMRFIIGKREYIEEKKDVKIIFPSSKKEHSIVIKGKSADSITEASEKIQLIIDQAVKSPILDYSHFISLPLAIHPELVDKLVRFQKSILEHVSKEGINEKSEDDSGADTSEDEVQQSEKALDVVEPKIPDNHERAEMASTSTCIPLISYAPKVSMSAPTNAPRAGSARGIERSVFINPKTFHLTVLMLKLWNEERIHLATEVFRSISSQVIDALDGRPVFVRLKGLECMKGSMINARVIHAPVEEIGNESRLLRACQVIIDAYVKAGLVLEKDATRPLKLHATLMNARPSKRMKGRNRKALAFDAREVFKQYGSEEWGDYHIREAHLSQRFLYDDNGYYHCCASMLFPQEDMELR